MRAPFVCWSAQDLLLFLGFGGRQSNDRYDRIVVGNPSSVSLGRAKGVFFNQIFELGRNENVVDNYALKGVIPVIVSGLYFTIFCNARCIQKAICKE